MANETTPVCAGPVNVPYGHVIGNEKWKCSQIAQGMQGKVKLILEDGLGIVDFYLSNRLCILYISEADLVTGNGFKRRLVCFRNVCNLQRIVIVEKTQLSDQYFPTVQKFVVLELGMTLLPVTNQGEAAQLIIQLVFPHSLEKSKLRGDMIALFKYPKNGCNEDVTILPAHPGRVIFQAHEQMNDPASNPFLNKRSPKLLEASLFHTVQQIPGVGKTKALLLLKQFGNLYQICNASIPELEKIVGCTLAQQIHTFFTCTK